MLWGCWEETWEKKCKSHINNKCHNCNYTSISFMLKLILCYDKFTSTKTFAQLPLWVFAVAFFTLLGYRRITTLNIQPMLQHNGLDQIVSTCYGGPNMFNVQT